MLTATASIIENRWPHKVDANISLHVVTKRARKSDARLLHPCSTCAQTDTGGIGTRARTQEARARAPPQHQQSKKMSKTNCKEQP